ncbi:MAG: hypothetical protein SGJ18_05900 [Pseudomonadota bacterium]|nr:hypothetical protein [Pseudomonadota bacterium]
MKRLLISATILAFLALQMSCAAQKFGLAPEADKYNATVTWNNKIDILWIIDNTPSMQQHQTILANQIGAFADGLSTRNLDFHLGVTTSNISTDGERGKLIGNPKVLTGSTPNFRNQFVSRVVLPEVDHYEQGLGAMKKAIEIGSNDNAGFFRADAFLVVVVFSNEDDHSEGNAQDYINFLESYKKPTQFGERMWTFHTLAVMGTAGEGCSTNGQFTEPGYEYMGMTNFSGGIKTSICVSDFKQALSGIEKKLWDSTAKFILDRIPVVESIEVRINGELVPNDAVNGWTYHEEDNSIRLHGTSVARIDSSLTINYNPTTAK